MSSSLCVRVYESHPLSHHSCISFDQSLFVHLFGFHFFNSRPWNALVLLCYLLFSKSGLCWGSAKLVSADASVKLHTPLVCCPTHDAAALPADTHQSRGSVNTAPYLTELSHLVWYNINHSIVEEEQPLLGLADWWEAGSAGFGMLVVLLTCYCCSVPECLSIPARELNIFVLCVQFT